MAQQQENDPNFNMPKVAGELVGSLTENFLTTLAIRDTERRQQIDRVALKAIGDFKKIKADPSLLDLLIVTDQGWEFKPPPPVIPDIKDVAANGTKTKQAAKVNS